MAGFNISSFFGNSKSNGLDSINLGDYALIRSGSYKKLMKSYYAKAKDTQDKSSQTNRINPTQASDTSGYSKIKSKTDDLKKAVQALNENDLWKQTDGAYDKEKIAGAVKKFAEEYNSVVSQSSEVNSKDVAKQAGYITSMTKTMSGALSKVGITVGTDNKLSVDEEALKKADAKNVKSLFSGSYSYASQIANNAGALGSAAVRSSSMYSSDGTVSSAISGMYEDWM